MLAFLAAAVALAIGPCAAQSAAPTRQEAAEARAAFAAGLIASDKGDLRAARAEFARASALVPDWSLAALQLGIVAQTLDPDDPEGLAALEKAVKLDGTNARAHLFLGAAYDRQHRLEEAERELKRALELRPTLLEARYQLAVVCGERGLAQQAIEEYLRVLDVDSRNVGALAGLAEQYEAIGQNANAEIALVTITRLFPEVLYHRYRLADFYRRTGAAAKAERVFAELEQLDPRQRKMRKLR